MTEAGGHLTPDTSDTVFLPNYTLPLHPARQAGKALPNRLTSFQSSRFVRTPAVPSPAQPKSTELSLGRGYLGPC